MASIGAMLVDFAISFSVLVVLMLHYELLPGASFLLVFPLTTGAIVTALGVGLLVSALNAVYRDVKYVLPFLVQIWMFVTPVIYPVRLVPVTFQWLLYLNPMAGIVNGYRSAILGQPLT